MDRRERGVDLLTGIHAALAGLQAGIYTSTPGIIQSFDPVKRTCVIQPTLKAQVQSPDGSKTWVTLPLLVDCPVVFPSGGGFTLTFPLAAGDETLVVFASRCIDAWWLAGGVQVQAELRMHDISDGFSLAGISSVPNVIPAISADKVQLRDDAGTTFLELDPVGNAKLKAAGNATVEAGGDANVTAAGNVVLTSTTQVSIVAPIVLINGINFNTHTHPITSGSSAPGPTGVPT